MGKAVCRWLAVNDQRVVYNVEIKIGTDTGKLNGPVFPGIGAECLVVMPVKSLRIPTV